MDYRNHQLYYYVCIEHLHGNNFDYCKLFIKSNCYFPQNINVVSPSQECGGSSCLQGKCANIHGTPTCICYNGFSGANCQTDSNGRNSPCNSSPCQVGKCISLTTSGAASYFCYCSPGVNNPECYNATANTPNQKCPGSCSNNPCTNGLCYNYFSYSTYYCSCPSANSGRNCDQSSTSSCSPNPCQNGGRCMTTYNGKAYSCNCSHPFSGQRCEITLACSTNPCMNGGNCTNQGNGSTYACACPFPYTGSNCATMLACANDPCMNGGTCIDKAGGSYTCTCPNSYGGQNCSTFQPCGLNPCMNGGICQPVGNSYSCKCLHPYQGTQCQTRPQQDGDVRLANSVKPGVGLAQVYFNGTWGEICSYSFGTFGLGEASVICQQLGYSGASAYTRTSTATKYVLGRTRCLDDEISILMCNYAGFGVISDSCSTSNAVSVTCRNQNNCNTEKNKTCAAQNKVCRSIGFFSTRCVCKYGYTGPNCTTPIVTLPLEGSVRIYDYYKASNASVLNVAKGAIEIFHNGVWGSICTSNDDSIAVMACKQLGYSVGYKRSYCCDYSGPSRKIWINTMTCTGSESSIANCSFTYGKNTFTCFNRFRVECINSTCQTNPCLNNGVCSLNHTTVFGIPATIAQCHCPQGYYGDKCQLRNFCNPNSCENNGQCTPVGTVSYTCKCSYSYAGNRCEKGPFTNKSITLVAGRPYHPNVGRVQYFYNNEQRPICSSDFTLYDAHVVCQQMGFAGATSITSSAAFGSPLITSGMRNLKCSGYESSIFDCPGSNPNNTVACFSSYAGVYCATNNSCSSNPCTNGGTCSNKFYGYSCKCSGQFTGQNCQDATFPTSGSVRLVNGSNPLSGRVEVYLNNNWSTVCLNQSSIQDMKVICKQMGYIFANAFPTPVFGQGNTATIYQLKCTGTENSVKDCPAVAVTNQGGCTHQWDLSLACSGANAKNGDLRLASTSNTGGIVQVFYQGTWGTICRSSSSFLTFRQVCQQLGFRTYSSTKAVATRFFGYGPTIVNKVTCEGKEFTIDECNSAGWYNVPQDCQDHSQDLSIECLTGSRCDATEIQSCAPQNKYCTSEGFYGLCYCKSGFTGAKCESPIVSPEDGTVKLVKSTTTSNTIEGAPLIYHDGIWGAFCYSQMTKLEADVICRELGYTTSTKHSCCYTDSNTFEKVWVYNMKCNSTATKFSQCNFTYGLNAYSCSSRAKVQCSNTTCSPNTCVNGTCKFNTSVVDGKTYYFQYCECKPGTYGPLCQYISVCDSSPCMNGAKCVNSYSTVDKNYYQCQCSSGYYGNLCQYGPPKTGDVNIIPESISNLGRGRIEVYLQGIWTTVCKKNFTNQAADVVCQQRGYAGAITSGSFYDSGTGKIGLYNVRCSGFELLLSECSYDTNNAESICNHDDDVGVSCYTSLNYCYGKTCYNGGTCRNMNYGYKCLCTTFYSGQLCENYIGPSKQGDVQLKNGVNATEGRVEVYVGDRWATLCDKVATINDGKVICNQLNLTFSRYLPKAYFGRGNSSAAIVSTSCTGNEISLRACNIKTLTSASGCTHANDVSILCSTSLCQRQPCQNGGTCVADSLNFFCQCPPQYTGQYCQFVTDGSVKLVRVFIGFFLTRYELQLFHNNEWRPVCDDGFTTVEAKVACKQLGFVGYKRYYCCGSHFGKYWLKNVDCVGTESSLTQCEIGSYDAQCSSSSAVMLECTTDACDSSPCSFRGTCQLVNGSVDAYTCVCQAGYTGPTCSSKIQCSTNPCGQQATCINQNYGFSCLCPPGFHGKNCSEKATDGDVRLTTPQGNNDVSSGTLQIYKNGTWGSVCDFGTFNTAAGKLICSKLNYPILISIKKNSFYGGATGSIPYSGITCTGNETSILNCNLRTQVSSFCDYTDLVGLSCTDNPCYSSPCHYGTCVKISSSAFTCKCTPGFIGSLCNQLSDTEPLRLLGGPNRYSGNLEVFFKGRWGSVCDDRFDLKDANVACRQLGFASAKDFACCSKYGSKVTPYWLDDLDCTGTETALSLCKHSAWGVANCGNLEVASIECQGNWCNASVCAPNATCHTILGAESFYCECPPGYYGLNCQLGPVANGAVRISGTSIISGTGFVEVYQNGAWGTVCNNNNVDITTASVLCRAAGYGNATNVYSFPIYGKGKEKIQFDSLKCFGHETSPSDCTRRVPALANCTHDMDLAIKCSNHYCYTNKQSCNNRGVCVAMSQDDEYICQCNKGFTGKDCQTDINECANNPCQSVAGGRAVCKDYVGYYTCQCPEGYSGYNCLFYSTVIGIRLTGSSIYSQGLVEVYNGQTWGKVCNSFWQFQDAQVACRQLGFADTQLRSQCCGNSSMTTIIGKIGCTGKEPNLANCTQSNLAGDISQCSTTMGAQAFCVDQPLDPNLNGANQLPSNYVCQTEISACLSSPCGNSGATCLDILKPTKTYACLCDFGYWNGNACVKDMTLSQVMLAANATQYFVGQYLSLQCMAYSYPISSILWAKNDVQIISNANIGFVTSTTSGYIAKSVLYFKSLKRGDNGVYSCSGLDSSGKVVKSNLINLQFSCSPQFCSNQGQCVMSDNAPSCSSCNAGYTGTYCESALPPVPLRSVIVKSNLTTYTVGQYAGLDCEALSYPLSTITWTVNNALVTSGNKYNIVSIPGNNYYQARSSMYFMVQSINDNGAYSCSARQSSTSKVVKSNTINISLSCSSLLCNNNGQCNMVNSIPICSCNAYHTGIYCQTRLPDIPLSTVSVTSNATTYTYGAYIALTCQTTTRPISGLSWTKNGASISTGSNVMITYSASADQTVAKSVLLFSNLTLSNNGDFRCTAKYNQTGATAQSSIVSIRMSCSTGFCNNNGICSTVTGSDLLQCSCNFGVIGNQCQTVLPNLPISIVTGKSNVTRYYVGTTIGLQCEATARPRPRFVWLHNGNQISIGGRLTTFLSPLNSNQKSIMNLVISNVVPSDAGSYRCRVIGNNNTGGNTDIVEIAVATIQFACSPAFCNSQGQCTSGSSGPVCSCDPLFTGTNCENQLSPFPISMVSITSNTSTFMVGSYSSLRCQANGRPLPSITWTKNKVPITAGNTTEIIQVVSDQKSVITSYLVFSPLSIGDNGAYSCRFFNATNIQLIETQIYDISFVCSQGYCSNNGQCSMNNNRPICSCAGGFGGDNCQSATTQNAGTYVGIAIGSVVAILIVVVAYIFLRKKGMIEGVKINRQSLKFGQRSQNISILKSKSKDLDNPVYRGEDDDL
ncbi:Deleted in malignant brain tumors 1 protein [Trichoplax sp. H2]|nr:Deleted in malignant brain tumors 1 protein [Trichoplax sp. H2]|eukprot:RDD45648.1 Deleted in malignant brain tumors 1 protein [Trichoplax sp. H2]